MKNSGTCSLRSGGAFQAISSRILRRQIKALAIILSIVAPFLLQTSAQAQNHQPDQVTHLAKLIPSDTIAGDQAGNAVAISGNIAVIGAMNAERSSLSSSDPKGAAYVYRFNGSIWQQEQKLLAGDAAASDRFGYSVAISDNTIFVGTPMDDNARGTDAGSVYVFRHNGTNWNQVQQIIAADSATGDWFGSSIAASGNVLFVAAATNDQAGTNAGAVYVFNYNGSSWVQVQKILPTDTTGFGWPVSMSGNLALVGNSSNSNANGSAAGAAYAYRYNGSSWVFVQKIMPADGAANDQFGFSVSVSDSLAVIGARYDADRGNMAGSAYVFRYNTTSQQWSQEAKLLDLSPQAPHGQPGNMFGSTVGISGTTIVVGSYYWDDQRMEVPLQDQGAAYIYTYQSATQQWLEQKRLVAGDGWFFDHLGEKVAISGNNIIASAPSNDARAMDSGAGYIFGVGCVSSAGCDDGNECTDNICNSNGTCSNPAKANNTVCSDDGNFCTNDFCSAGACTHPAKTNGTTCGEDGNSCTNDICTSGVCTHPNKAAGSACGNPNSTECDNADTCNGSGSCITNNVATGTACTDDGNQCTRDYCVSGTCTHPNTPSGWACNDGSSCTTGDSCTSGTCGGTSTCNSNAQCCITYTLNTNTSGNGSGTVSRSNTLPAYPPGADVVLTANAAAGSTFTGWSGSVSGTQNPITIEMNSNSSVTATFSLAGSTPPKISTSSPLNGFIETLEDQDATSGALLGNQNVYITFSEPVLNNGGSALTLANNFRIKFYRGGTTSPVEVLASQADLARAGQAPTVSLVSGSGAGPYRLQFLPRIPLGAWTEIAVVNAVDAQGTAISTTGYDNRVVLGFSPMNIDQNQLVNGSDINRWLAVNNDVYDPAPLTKIQLLDQKRDGLVNGADITRAIQLINGIGSFRAWSGFDLGARP